MQITTTGSHEAQDELGNLLVPVASSFTQTDINKLPNKKQAQGRKKGYHSIKIKKNSFVKATSTGGKKSPSNENLPYVMLKTKFPFLYASTDQL